MVAAGAFGLSGGCQGHALEVVLCRNDVAPYVTDWSASFLGMRDVAFVRLLTPDDGSSALVMKSCDIAKQPFDPVTYPNVSPPAAFPSWWDIQVDEEVDYTTLYRFDGDWTGIAYRKKTSQGTVWLMRAGY